MTRPPQRLVALRQSQPFDTIRRQLVFLDAPPVAVVSEVEEIMARWWLREGGYPVGRIFATWRVGRA
jgi:hypothetical protein